MHIILASFNEYAGDDMSNKCRYLEMTYFASPICIVDKNNSISRVFVFDEYKLLMCLQEKHRNCPFYRKSMLSLLRSMPGSDPGEKIHPERTAAA
jgi:hypothetical protein